MEISTVRKQKTGLGALLCVAASAALAGSAAAQSVHRQKIQITAGPTVHVSAAVPNLPHYESLSVGDPDHAGRLISCVSVIPGIVERYSDQNCYVSSDSGKTWDPSLKITQGWMNADPTAAYGLNDDVYVVVLAADSFNMVKNPDPDMPSRHTETAIYKSTDGGRTWNKSSSFEFIDREFIVVDKTNGKYSGRVYVVGQGGVKGISGGGPSSIDMWRSSDGGKTFKGPIVGSYPEGGDIFGVGTGAVLSDGTFVVLFGHSKPGRSQILEQEPRLGPNVELSVISSKDGGETFSPAHKVADIKLDRPHSEGSILNQMAADPGSKAFKDRLYAVFPAIVSDRVQIQCAYSADKGKTWSNPVVVNDDRSPEKGDKGPDHLLPAVGVNKDGVVLVAWYDRREAKDNLGWRIRAAASLDGGETFSASVPITSFVNSYTQNTPWDIQALGFNDESHSLVSVGLSVHGFFISSGHTSGLAVDADGTFHPTWIDNHAGVPQLWTASLKVDGTAVKNGAPDLSDLKDISKSVSLELSKPSFDRAHATLTMQARLKNISKDKVEGPVKVRVLTLESQLGVAEITNADNGQNGTGAVWDFSSTLSGPLESMKLGAPKTLTFRVTEVRQLSAGKDFKGGILNMETKVFGKIQKEKKDQASGEDKDDQQNSSTGDDDWDRD
jgi:hypothetical protein